jgi:putative toxin-antitoxin system antitoxin component (TIGR02293 family)
MNEAVRAMLGLRARATTRVDLAESIERGLPAGAIDRVKDALDLADIQVSSALGISSKTMGRLRKARRRLPVPVGDRLYRLARVFALARDVIEDDGLAREWLRSPQVGLNNRAPLDLLVTDAGAREVEDLLLRIEYGVLA